MHPKEHEQLQAHGYTGSPACLRLNIIPMQGEAGASTHLRQVHIRSETVPKKLSKPPASPRRSGKDACKSLFVLSSFTEIRSQTHPFFISTQLCTKLLLFFPWFLVLSSPASLIQCRNPTSMSVFPTNFSKSNLNLHFPSNHFWMGELFGSLITTVAETSVHPDPIQGPHWV